MGGHSRASILSLYRSLLRLHSKLPPEMQQLGNSYVRSEFRQHQNITDPNQIQQFVTEWTRYQHHIMTQQQQQQQSQLPSTNYGQSLSNDDIVQFNDEQQNQLNQLQKEAQTLVRSTSTSSTSTSDPIITHTTTTNPSTTTKPK